VAIDAQMRGEHDEPTIWPVAVQAAQPPRGRVRTARHRQPVGVAEYHLIKALPEALADSQPSVEDPERELGSIESP
jgi:hypothetical protein